eukprot:5573435-Pyramimonas_sp.AAC.1
MDPIGKPHERNPLESATKGFDWKAPQKIPCDVPNPSVSWETRSWPKLPWTITLQDPLFDM